MSHRSTTEEPSLKIRWGKKEAKDLEIHKLYNQFCLKTSP